MKVVVERKACIWNSLEGTTLLRIQKASLLLHVDLKRHDIAALRTGVKHTKHNIKYNTATATGSLRLLHNYKLLITVCTSVYSVESVMK